MRCSSAHRRLTSELRRLSTQCPARAARSASRLARRSWATLTAGSEVVFWVIDFTVVVIDPDGGVETYPGRLCCRRTRSTCSASDGGQGKGRLDESKRLTG